MTTVACRSSVSSCSAAPHRPEVAPNGATGRTQPGQKGRVTTPSLTLTGLASRRSAPRRPFAQRLAYPVLLTGLALVLLGYAALGLLLVQMLLGAF